jgi:hypothetical protein
MWQFGDLAVGAIERLKAGKAKTLAEAYDVESHIVFPHSESLRAKICPRSSLFGLCEIGVVVGVPEGVYNRSPNNKNKQHILDGLQLLLDEPELADEGPSVLWKRVMHGRIKQSNSQMHVLITLWKSGRIDKDRARLLLEAAERE